MPFQIAALFESIPHVDKHPTVFEWVAGVAQSLKYISVQNG